VLLAMQDGLQDEYRAAAVYEAVLQRYGQVLPFSNIVRAERQHAASIAALFTARGFAVPTPEAQVEIPAFASVAAACEMGATAEVENIALYDRTSRSTTDCLPRRCPVTCSGSSRRTGAPRWSITCRHSSAVAR